MQGRLSTLNTIDPYVGKYYSVEWVKKNVLKMSDDDIEAIEKQKEDDRKSELDKAAHDGTVQVAQQSPMLDYHAEQQQEQQAQENNTK